MTDFFRRLVKEKPLSIVAGVVILLLILVAIFADVLAPYSHDEVNIVDRMQAPSNRYLLGTDQLGRDLLSRLVFGARISLTVGLAATTVNVVVAVLIGGISGFFGGRLDLAMQRFVDAWMAFPGLLLLLTIMSLVGRGLPQIIVVLGVTGGIGGSRVVRGAVIGVKENAYFQAAEAIALRRPHGLVRHVEIDRQAGFLYRFPVPEGLPMIYETTYSNARAHLASLMDQVTDTREPILIRRRGAEPVALVAAGELAGWMETAYLLRSPKNAQRLLDGNRRAAAEEGIPLSIEQLRERLGLEGA
ncbi:MAG: type II toxin-antitoxin system prevent-host-death family antitoxin [Spirochaetaceae bacterium]|nr:type II toxin-antitoxin system prevent-host-death family antitoxin [Spirochaetaceae bacterium]